MSYTHQGFVDHDENKPLTAAQLIAIEDAIIANEQAISKLNAGVSGDVKVMTIQGTDNLLQKGDITFEGFDVTRTVVGSDYPNAGTYEFTNSGYINVNTGLVVTGNTWIYSDFLDINQIVSAQTFVSHASVAAVAYYSDKDFSTYLGGYVVNSWGGAFATAETILSKAPDGAKYVVFSTNGDTQMLSVELSEGGASSVQYIIKPNESEEETKESISKNMGVSPRMVHFSFDDTIASLRDLTEKSASYNSVFDQPFFKVLKELHDTYGAVFSCYCFYQILNSTDSSVVDFSLEDVTDAYAEEFTANAHWLKFGYHSLHGSMNYGSGTAEDAKTHYDNFITQIVRITGSVKCIDLVVRLQNFAGNKASCQAMRDCACGIIGFLAGDYAEAGKTLPVSFADYTVAGYYLAAPASTFLAHHGRYFDAAEQLYFYPSCLRLDNISSANVPTYMNYFNTKDMYGRSSTLIMYCHENQMFRNGSVNVDYKKRMAYVCDWGVANNYSFGFPMDKIRQAY